MVSNPRLFIENFAPKLLGWLTLLWPNVPLLFSFAPTLSLQELPNLAVAVFVLDLKRDLGSTAEDIELPKVRGPGVFAPGISP